MTPAMNYRGFFTQRQLNQLHAQHEREQMAKSQPEKPLPSDEDIAECAAALANINRQQNAMPHKAGDICQKCGEVRLLDANGWHICTPQQPEAASPPAKKRTLRILSPDLKAMVDMDAIMCQLESEDELAMTRVFTWFVQKFAPPGFKWNVEIAR
jgi:hypothetical protein